MPDPQAILRFLRDPNLQTGPFPQWPTMPPMQQPQPRYLENDPTPWEGGDFPTRVDPMSVAMALMAGKGAMKGAQMRPQIVPRGNGMYDVHVGGKFAGTASVASDGTKPFISAVDIGEDFRRSGIASQLYDKIESDIGRPLVPSPLGLSPDAVAFWKSRLSGLNPEKRASILQESRSLGHGYGIKDSDIDLRLKPLELPPIETSD